MTPLRALAADLADLGAPRFFRPYNDTRFHARPPLKEHVAATVGDEGAGGWYVELSLDGLLVAGGLHAPARDQVSRMRRAIDEARAAGELTSAIRTAEREGLALNPPDLARGPQGVARDHPRLDLLRRRRLVVYRLDELGAWLHEPEAGRRTRAALDAATPLVHWLHRHVGRSQEPRRR